VDILAVGGSVSPREVPMRTITAAFLAALFAPLLCTAAQDKQEEAAEMKWTFQEGDRFDLKWGYSDQRKREPGRGETTESHDKRDVEAELTWKAEGILTLTLKKVVWSYGSQDYEVSLTYLDGKKLDPQMKMKIESKATGYNVSKAEADRMMEYMKNLTNGEFTINTIEEKGRTNFLWNGGNVRTNNLSLFDRLYTHPLLPSGPVRVGQIFKDPLEVTNLPPGLVEVKTVESKVTAVGDKGSIAKGGVSVPIAKTFTANSVTQTMNGNFTYSCEWNYSPRQYLQGAKEEVKLTKKVDGKGSGADFYKENYNHTISQALSIKKKDPKPGEEKKKPADAKPEEKKPEEKAEEKK
jgi:hypothetical protein